MPTPEPVPRPGGNVDGQSHILGADASQVLQYRLGALVPAANVLEVMWQLDAIDVADRLIDRDLSTLLVLIDREADVPPRTTNGLPCLSLPLLLARSAPVVSGLAS